MDICVAPQCGEVKSDKFSDHVLQCETIIQHLNLFAIDH